MRNKKAKTIQILHSTTTLNQSHPTLLKDDDTQLDYLHETLLNLQFFRKLNPTFPHPKAAHTCAQLIRKDRFKSRLQNFRKYRF